MAVASFGNTPTVGLDTNYDFVPSAMEGAQAGQAMRGISALQGVNINDPDSLNQAIGASIRAGQFAQGSALMGLPAQRAALATRTAAMTGGGLVPSDQSGATGIGAPQGPPSEDEALAQQRATSIMKFGKQAADQLLSIQDPQLRQDAADAIGQQATSMGVDAGHVQALTGDLSDQHLHEISDNFNQWLQHPSFGGEGYGEGAPPALHSATVAHMASAPNYLNNPAVINKLSAMQAAGIDIGPQVEALKASQGYTGAIGPGMTAVAQGGPTYQSPYAPEALGPGQALKNPNTGGSIGEPVPLPKVPVTVGPGQNAGGFNQNTGQFTGPAAGANAATGAVTTAPGVSPAGTGPGKYNNPAGVTPLAHGKWPGQTDVAPNGMVVFDNPTDGYNAADKNLVAYSGEGINTVAGVINKWTPPGHGNPDQTPRIAAVARQMGVAPNAPIDLSNPLVRHQLLAAMIPGEGTAGGAPAVANAGAPSGGVIPGGVGMTGGPMYAPPAAVAGLPGKRQVSATGEVGAPAAGTFVEPGAFRQGVASDPRVTSAQEAITNYEAMRNNAATMDGPTAMGMIDGIVRAYSGGVARLGSVQALMNTFGIAQNLQAGIGKALEGKGPLTMEMRQQLADAAYNYTTAHYDQAATYVGNQQKYIRGVNGDDTASATATQGLLPPRPYHMYVTAPPASAAVKGAVIDTTKGLREWNGAKWVPVNG